MAPAALAMAVQGRDGIAPILVANVAAQAAAAHGLLARHVILPWLHMCNNTSGGPPRALSERRRCAPAAALGRADRGDGGRARGVLARPRDPAGAQHAHH